MGMNVIPLFEGLVIIGLVFGFGSWELWKLRKERKQREAAKAAKEAD